MYDTSFRANMKTMKSYTSVPEDKVVEYNEIASLQQTFSIADHP